ncbi:MAG TPA: tetratricopeptide repeat protein [Terriglobales bacterium]|nr:tetratricopeptide repeat protein [Terriglobales bacterium]
MLGVALCFIAVSFLTRQYKERRDFLARSWYARGEQALAAGDSARAIADLRNALAYDRDNSDYYLLLGEALERAGQGAESRSYLLGLLEADPASGRVNLDLARIAAGEGAIEQARRYYHNAIYGFWPENAPEQRRRLRFELARLLLRHKLRNEADSELVALLETMPRGSPADLQAGELLLEAGDYSRAYEVFTASLRSDKRNIVALAGAGEAAFQQGDYRSARSYLARAVELGPVNTRAAELLAAADEIARVNPLAPLITSAERVRRVRQAVKTASARIADCISSTPRAGDAQSASALVSLAAQLAGAEKQAARLHDNPEAIAAVLSTVFAAEAAAERNCGPATGADLALLRIGRSGEARVP